MEDRRAVRTKKVIQETFLDLLKKKDISKITVSEITRVSNIGRGTFYLHYLDVNDLQEKLEDKICSDLSDIFDETYPFETKTDFLKMYITITNYVAENSEQISFFFIYSKNNNLMQKIKDMFIKKTNELMPPDKMTEYENTENLFIVSGVVGVIEDWLRNYAKRDKQTIAEELNILLKKIK